MIQKKIVINGFFRSGTSAIWNNLKNNNNNSLVFYEPCHPFLIKLIKKEGGYNPLHGYDIWSEYDGLDKSLMAYHPYIGRSPYGVDIRGYLEYFEKKAKQKNKRLILQTNRWHFNFLRLDEKNYTVFHVVRSSEDVYASMKKAYMKNSLLRNALKTLELKVTSYRFWEFKWMHEYIHSIYSCELLDKSKLVTKLTLSLEEQFVLIWTLTNYIAIKSINDENNVISFHKICEKNYITNKFSPFNLDWDPSYFMKEKTLTGSLQRHSKIASKLGIIAEYEFVKGFL